MYQSILILNLGSDMHSMRVESLTQVTSVPRSCHNTLPYRSSGLCYLVRLVRATQNQAVTGVYYPCKHIDAYNVRFTVHGPYTSGKITHFHQVDPLSRHTALSACCACVHLHGDLGLHDDDCR